MESISNSSFSIFAIPGIQWRVNAVCDIYAWEMDKISEAEDTISLEATMCYLY